MCFDLIKEGIVDKVKWIATKIGIVANESDQIDEERTRYANFEYETSKQMENNFKNSIGEINSNNTAIRYESNDDTWAKGIRNKSESIVENNKGKKEVKIDDEKH